MSRAAAAPRPHVLVLYAPWQRACGIRSFCASLGVELEHRGWEVTVALAQGATFHDPRIFETAEPGLRTTWMDARTGTEEGRIQSVMRAIQDTRPTVVLDNCIASAFEAVRRLRAAGDRSFRFVVANHGSLPSHAACILANADVVDGVVSVNRLSALAMQGEPSLAAGRVHHLANAVPEPRRIHQRDPSQPWRIGYAGRLEEDKRFGDVIPFFRRLAGERSDVELWIAGDGALLPRAQELAEELPGRVRLLGMLTREQLYADFYPGIDVAIHLSAAEGWSLAIGEAMAHGVVPVTSAFRGLHAEGLLRHDETALVFPVGEPSAAASLVSSLIDDPDRWSRLAANARSRIESAHTIEIFADGWDGLLREMAAAPLAASRASSGGASAGMAERYRERMRRILRRHFPHRSAGEEWPHFACTDSSSEAAMLRRMERLEEEGAALARPVPAR